MSAKLVKIEIKEDKSDAQTVVIPHIVFQSCQHEVRVFSSSSPAFSHI